MLLPGGNPPLPTLLYERARGNTQRHVFQSSVGMLRGRNVQLLEDSQIASPHHNGGIPTLDIDRVEERFLLAGGSDATISIYDLSTWGTEHHLKGGSSVGRPAPVSVYKPVAQSMRASPTLLQGDNQEDHVPSGHSHSIVQAQWYPVDTGAFVSAAAEGSILVWDTHSMIPVVRWRPFDLCRCFHLSTRRGVSQTLLAVGSENETVVKLLDLRSGASSHSLVGHNRGITTVQWSPTCDVVLASGARDGTIRLWDIRKSGSNACLSILDRDVHGSSDILVSRRYTPTYAHLMREDKRIMTSGATTATMTAPSNYRHAETTAILSHGGPISAISFCPDGHSLVSTGKDGRLHLWDLRGLGYLVPTRFLFQTNQPAVSRTRSRVPLVVSQAGYNNTMVWLGHGQCILGYCLERGGTPTQILDGHLQNVTCITTHNGMMRLVSGGKDGMILSWGCPPPSSQGRNRPSSNNQNGTAGSKQTRDDTLEDRDNW